MNEPAHAHVVVERILTTEACEEDCVIISRREGQTEFYLSCTCDMWGSPFNGPIEEAEATSLAHLKEAHER